MIRNLLVLILAVAISATAFGMENVNPYRVTVTASGDVNADRRIAFEQMILKLTGSRASMQNPLIAQADVGNYLQQFSYQRSDRNDQQKIEVLFNEKRVNQLVMQAGLRLWGKQRPVLLAWYVTENGPQRSILGETDIRGGKIRASAEWAALPVRIPVMDLDDSMALSSGDIWGNFDANVYTASQRYGTELALTVKHFRQGDIWLNQWRVLDLIQRQPLLSGLATGSASEVDLVMWEQLADAMAERYAVTMVDDANNNLDSGLSLTFDGVRSLSQFKALEATLTQHPSVASVMLKSVNEQEYTFSVQLIGRWSELQAALALSQDYRADSFDPYRYHFVSM